MRLTAQKLRCLRGRHDPDLETPEPVTPVVPKAVPGNGKGKAHAEVATEEQEYPLPHHDLPLAKDLVEEFLQQQVTNERMLQRSEDILDAILGINQNLVKMNRL